MLASKSLVPGLPLKLEHQPHNKFDPNAVAVKVGSSGDMLGHIPREEAAQCVSWIRSKQLISAEVLTVLSRRQDVSVHVRLTIEKDEREVRVVLYRPPKPPDSRYFLANSFRPQTKYSKLSSLFGSAVEELRDAFLALPDKDLDSVLAAYEAAHGEKAAHYARQTYPHWKFGRVKLSGQTMERLLELVPPHLSSLTRFSLLRSVVSKNKRPPTTRELRINRDNPAPGIQELLQALASMSHSDLLAHLPESVMAAANWLYDGDITAARAMLAEVERKENDLLRSKAASDIARLEGLIASRSVSGATYHVSLPTGRLEVAVFAPTPLSRLSNFLGFRKDSR